MRNKTIMALFVTATLVLCMMSVSRADSTADQGDVDLRSGGGNEASVLFIGDGLTNNAANPDLDTWIIKCSAKTTICADVNPFGTFNDNTVHVSVVCVSPIARRGFGELEYGIDGAISDSACVPSCTEAIVAFQCEAKDNCDENYDSVMTCVGKNFATGYPKRKE